MRLVFFLPESLISSSQKISQLFINLFHFFYVQIRINWHLFAFWLISIIEPIPNQEEKESFSDYLDRISEKQARRVLQYWLFLLPEIDFETAEEGFRNHEFGKMSYRKWRKEIQEITAQRMSIISAAYSRFSEDEVRWMIEQYSA